MRYCTQTMTACICPKLPACVSTAQRWDSSLRYHSLVLFADMELIGPYIDCNQKTIRLGPVEACMHMLSTHSFSTSIIRSVSLLFICLSIRFARFTHVPPATANAHCLLQIHDEHPAAQHQNNHNTGCTGIGMPVVTACHSDSFLHCKTAWCPV